MVQYSCVLVQEAEWDRERTVAENPSSAGKTLRKRLRSTDVLQPAALIKTKGCKVPLPVTTHLRVVLATAATTSRSSLSAVSLMQTLMVK